ncbi:hypothetical protein [uncultured Fusobacterium sp.]|uniref:hypothetical protein n=1 Tax=uncultured Fusobacterium sp. TaxID=159267 RepID=UPI0027DBF9FD|nr:hypothetical protein [uncultured Fusobacterium sp.]
MSDFQIALIIFTGLIIFGVVLFIFWNDTMETIFTIIGLIFQMIWYFFLFFLAGGLLILLLTFTIHIYRMDM